MSRTCEIHHVNAFGGNPPATHRATFDQKRFPTRGKFRFDLCATHAADAVRGGAVVTTITESKE